MGDDFGYPSNKGLVIGVKSCEEEDLKQLRLSDIQSDVGQLKGLWHGLRNRLRSLGMDSGSVKSGRCLVK